jgi:hypothetical protein
VAGSGLFAGSRFPLSLLLFSKLHFLMRLWGHDKRMTQGHIATFRNFLIRKFRFFLPHNPNSSESTEMLIDPHRIFLQAENFHQASKLINHVMRESPAGDWHPELLVPDIVVTAFACEIYLKCLIAIDRKTNPPYWHELDRLYGKLSQDLKSNLQRKWEQYLSTSKQRQRIESGTKEMPQSLARAIKYHADHFEDFRYIYEMSDPKEFYLNGLLNILRNTALEFFPKWGEFKRVIPPR